MVAARRSTAATERDITSALLTCGSMQALLCCGRLNNMLIHYRVLQMSIQPSHKIFEMNMYSRVKWEVSFHRKRTGARSTWPDIRRAVVAT
jgi:hypothetical protein